MINRRFFLKSSGLALVGGSLLPNVFVRMANASTTKATQGPRGDLSTRRGRRPQRHRPLRRSGLLRMPGRRSPCRGPVPRPNRRSTSTATSALHPSLASLVPYFKRPLAGHGSRGRQSRLDALAFRCAGLHGVGHAGRESDAKTDSCRAQSTPGNEADASPLRAVALSPALPRILSGSAGAVAMTNIAAVRHSRRQGRRRAGVGRSSRCTRKRSPARSRGNGDGIVRRGSRSSRRAPCPRLPADNGAVYPQNPARQCAAPDRAADQVRRRDWRSASPTSAAGTRTPARAARRASSRTTSATSRDAIAAFAQRPRRSRMGDVVLVTMSEFGRTVARERQPRHRPRPRERHARPRRRREGRQGLRHDGRGSRPQQLYEGRDVAVTTDFRDVFGELITKQLGVPALKSVFPGYEATPSKWRGVMG